MVYNKPSVDYPDGELNGADQDRGAIEGAIWAIGPLCGILLLVLIVGLRQKPKHMDELGIGIVCAIVGMTLLTLEFHWAQHPLVNNLAGM